MTQVRSAAARGSISLGTSPIFVPKPPDMDTNRGLYSCFGPIAKPAKALY